MNHTDLLSRIVPLLAAVSVLAAAPLPAQTVVDRWLVLGPVAARPPALSVGADTALGEAVALAVDRRRPEAGQAVEWLGGRELRWQERPAERGTLALSPPGGDSGLAYAAVYLESDRWQEARLAVEGTGLRTLWLDGRRVEGDRVRLERGKHLLVVQSVRPAGAAGAWRLTARLEPLTPGARLAVSLDPRGAPSLAELRAIPEVQAVAVDPAGRRVAWVVRTPDGAADRWVSHIEVRDLASGSLVAELRPGGEAFSPRWSRDGRRLAFTSPTGGEGRGTDLWVWDPAESAARRVLRGEPGLAGVQWSADGSWLYFTATTRADSAAPPKPGEARRLTEVWERWSFWPDKAHLHALHLEQGTRLKLAGDAEYSVSGPTLSPDGSRLVFTRDVRVRQRPFVRSEVWVLELPTLEARKVVDLPREIFNGPTTYAWSPDGRAVAFCASAEELHEQAAADFSVYETELFAVRLDEPRLRHLSAGFAPAVGSQLSCPDIHWSETDGRIYVAADVGALTLPARTRAPVTGALEETTLETMPLEAQVVAAHDFEAGWLVAAVETPTEPAVVQRIPLAGGEPATLYRPATGHLAYAEMPAWRPWSFRDAEGWEIESWYWLPPGFDASASYPMIVHYYGGTLPMKKEFEERLLWFAAQGYVVLMMNPAGTPGYGQEFANLHIDDWGYPAATDIIEGVTKFLEEHRFVDRKRIGNFGHSYGGFMTMHLLTRSDLFAAGVEIAGISNIANYWGAGWTGYSYTEGTCRGCYPWNRPDVFVERSPLFQADRIRAPLLLIHGTGDTNVVPTESEQMFTALRLLGREAELVRFHEENHGINSRPSVRNTLDTLLLEWFDKHLRGQPDAWTARWREEAPAAAATATNSNR